LPKRARRLSNRRPSNHPQQHKQHYEADHREGGEDSVVPGVDQRSAQRHAEHLVHPQKRLSAKCYADRHETTDLCCASTLGRLAQCFGGGPALGVRRLRPPSLPDPACQLQRRERLPDRPLVGLRSPDGTHRHKALQRVKGVSKRRCASALRGPRGSTPPSRRAVPSSSWARYFTGARGSSARTRACGPWS
jgi:hypothetical protein